MLLVRILRASYTTLCDKVCQWLETGWWFSPGTPVSSTNRTDRHDITEILLKVALNTIKQTNWFYLMMNRLKMSCCMVFYYENCSTHHDTFHFVNFLKNKNTIFTLTGLNHPHWCACPKPGHGFPMSYVMVFHFTCSVS